VVIASQIINAAYPHNEFHVLPMEMSQEFVVEKPYMNDKHFIFVLDVIVLNHRNEGM